MQRQDTGKSIVEASEVLSALHAGYKSSSCVAATDWDDYNEEEELSKKNKHPVLRAPI